jgi:hypothetical protein
MSPFDRLRMIDEMGFGCRYGGPVASGDLGHLHDRA